MSAEKFLNSIRLQANLANNKAFPVLGKITGYDPANFLVTVEIYTPTDDQPAFQTGWIPLMSPWVGNGWGMFCTPNIGDICEVHFQEGSIQNGYACLRNFNNNNLSLPVNSGEFWLVHKSGSYLKLTNNGKLLLNGNVEIDVTSPSININVTTDCNINANNVNIVATGSASINSTDVSLGKLSDVLLPLMNSVAADVYNGHTHNDPQGGVTGGPNQQIDETAKTINIKGN